MAGGRLGTTLFAMVAAIGLAMVGLEPPAAAQTKLTTPSTGFPVKISKAGSYFLGTNLVTTGRNTNVINVKTSNVTINLNGFRVGGPGTGGSGIGINAAGQTGLTIVNGSVSGMGGDGILVGGNSAVSGVLANSNGGDGVDCQGSGCVVTSSTANSNGAFGLSFTDATSGYNQNVINGNTSGTVTGGTSMGNNVCNGAAC